ncbi:hypothetical protein DPMN_108722 [Dreissena polymorpha]|uniref:Uncharacterized protein n=1 Tax=Dreissena polymorpha TaxID=45954 RepID=A0A9D4K9R2_DREPO|nr:hypothetical protein DPMN_108722 [Dreissena polymorpha]
MCKNRKHWVFEIRLQNDGIIENRPASIQVNVDLGKIVIVSIVDMFDRVVVVKVSDGHVYAVLDRVYPGLSVSLPCWSVIERYFDGTIHVRAALIACFCRVYPCGYLCCHRDDCLWRAVDVKKSPKGDGSSRKLDPKETGTIRHRRVNSCFYEPIT